MLEEHDNFEGIIKLLGFPVGHNMKKKPVPILQVSLIFAKYHCDINIESTPKTHLHF